MISVICLALFLIYDTDAKGSSPSRSTVGRYECGPNGFACVSPNKLKLCDAQKSYGPTFLCPESTLCNAESKEVCTNMRDFNFSSKRSGNRFTCKKSERFADDSVSDCKGYILCIPNKRKFIGMKLKCGGSTVFSPKTATCTAPSQYKCPGRNSAKHDQSRDDDSEFMSRMGTDSDREVAFTSNNNLYENPSQLNRPPIDCKSYRLRLPSSGKRAAYFCPKYPRALCTVFSNNFCITLEKILDDGETIDDEDIDINTYLTRRKPRLDTKG